MTPVEFLKSLGWKVTSPYGPRTGQYAGFHRGVDFGGYPCGAPVQAAYDGTITAAKTSNMGTWGNTVCLQVSEGYTLLYAHLQSISVREGQQVKQGDTIGLNGGSNHSGGNYACHIHLEVQRNTGDRPWRGTHIDPATFNLAPEKPSTKFKPGDTIKQILTSSSVWVRDIPGGRTIGSVSPGRTAYVLNNNGNGNKVSGYHWWYVQTPDAQGWIAENFFEVANELVITDQNRDRIIRDLVSDVANMQEYLNIRR
jgi:murein DD-endopeptidase MepM/ murein hydrolase activator NlpD